MERFFERLSRLVVLFPLNVRQGNVDVTIFVVRTQLDDSFKGTDRIFVLQGIKVSDADVIPAHPVLILIRKRRGRRIIAKIQRACF